MAVTGILFGKYVFLLLPNLHNWHSNGSHGACDFAMILWTIPWSWTLGFSYFFNINSNVETKEQKHLSFPSLRLSRTSGPHCGLEECKHSYRTKVHLARAFQRNQHPFLPNEWNQPLFCFGVDATQGGTGVPGLCHALLAPGSLHHAMASAWNAFSSASEERSLVPGQALTPPRPALSFSSLTSCPDPTCRVWMWGPVTLCSVTGCGCMCELLEDADSSQFILLSPAFPQVCHLAGVQ